MKAYLCLWRDLAGAPIAHQIIIAEGMLTAMDMAEAAKHGQHASIHRLHNTPETRHAIALAQGTPRIELAYQPGAEEQMSWAMQEDLENGVYKARPVTMARWAFVSCARWEDAQALADKVWSRGDHHKRGPQRTYALPAAAYHMQHWDVPLEACDLGFPALAPPRDPVEVL